ncbi:MAG TPA: DNA repair protein RecN [Acidiferrobacter sp.]|nr:DNA repair protein RecN [Acidiferrobacter sp.]
MLAELLVRSFAVIDELRIPLGAGFSVVTGETGAGKSLLVDALGLAVGERAEAGLVRAGAEFAEIVASFEIEPNGAADTWLKEHDLATQGQECIVRRLIGQDRSRAFINATPVPLQRLRELGDLLIDLHGQHEHQTLLRRETQRDLLDAYAGAAPERLALAQAVAKLHACEARLQTIRQDAANRSARESLLRYQIEELQSLQPEAGEWEGLNTSQKRLAHAQELGSGIVMLVDRLVDGDQPLVSALDDAVNQLRLLMRHEPRLAEVEALLMSATVEITEAGLSLTRIGGGMETEPADLPAIEARLGRWHELARKHRVPADQLPDLWATLKTEHDALQHEEETIAALEQELAQDHKAALAQARDLTAKRHAAEPALSAAVTEEMQRLGLGAGRFSVALTPETLTANGCEAVEFLVSPAIDSPFRPLAKVASGGELSRISLALQVVLADVCIGPTLVFDEVDVGIGGAVAEIVGQRLQELARSRQVLCITHLPQVAAQGDTHLLVHKALSDGRTMSSVEVLAASERVEEIARMLGGVAINAHTRALARDMLHG